MAEVLKKLNHKTGFDNLVINCPEGLENTFSLVYDDKVIKTEYDFIILFALDSIELTKLIPKRWPIKKGGLLWLAYPKKTAGIESDLSRDKLATCLKPQGYRPVSMISIDKVWSAMRFKPESDVKTTVPSKQSFEAIIETNNDSGGAWVTLPFDVKSVYGTGGWVKVKATFDGQEYRGSIADMGTGNHILIVTKEIRKVIKKDIGAKVSVTIEKDTSERQVEVPTELEELLKLNTSAAEFYETLSYTNRKEYANWISSAKRAETKEKRLKETLRRLNAGIKNPFAK